MNRRSILSLFASLPIIGALVKPSDGVALRSTSHPVGPEAPFDADLAGIVDAEISLTPYALSGEKVTCENGHVICEFMVDVFVGQTQDLGRQIGNWTQEAPMVGADVQVCAVCGGEFYKAGGVFHIEHGWRYAVSRPLRISR